MLTFLEDYPESNGTHHLVRYNIGTANTTNKIPDKVYEDVTPLMLNTNCEVVALEKGFFISQVRSEGQNTPDVPGFIYCDYEGNVLYSSADHQDIFPGFGSGIAVSADLKTMVAAAGETGIKVLDVEWSAEGVPTLTERYVLPGSGEKEIFQLDFDIAGNLHAYSKNNGYQVYAMPGEGKPAVTNAKSTLVIGGGESGIENLEYNSNAPVEYYNIQGIKVNPEEMGSGVYIKVQGTKSEKVFVK